MQTKQVQTMTAEEVKTRKCEQNSIAVDTKEYATFNLMDHMFVDLSDGTDTTISVNLANGQKVTFCVFQSAYCVDIDIHGEDERQTMLGFDSQAALGERFEPVDLLRI